MSDPTEEKVGVKSAELAAGVNADLQETVDDDGGTRLEEDATLALGSANLETSLANAETLLEASDDDQGTDSGGALLESGDSLGRLEVGEILGQGAFGVVVSAYDPDLKRKLAIKLLKPEVFESKSGRDAHKRLLREARAMAKISHANVVTVHDIGTVDGQVYIAMEFVEGGNLGQWLRAKDRSWQEILGVFVQAGRGLAAAHREGLVHRDFKPDNVLVNKSDEVRVADFGLVSISEKRGEALASAQENVGRSMSSGDLDLTRAGSVMGTALYMAPEQHLGDEVTPASDQFSFCVALYSAFYKRGPFPCRNYKELRKAVINGEVLSVPTSSSVPKWLQLIILKGLSVTADDRYRSMPALLEALCSDPSIRTRRRIKLAGAGVACAAVLAGLFWSQQDRKRPCQNADASLSEVWDTSRKSAIAGVFARDRSLEYARFEESIDRYTTDWVSVRKRVCEATHVHGEQSDALLDRRMLCLDQKLHYLQQVLAQLRSGTGVETLDKALTIASALPPPKGCTDRPELMSRHPLPTDEKQREKILVADRLVDEAEAHLDLGAQARAIDILEAMLKEPPDYSPTLAKATSVLGKSKMDLGDLTGAETSLRESIEHGTRAGDDRLVASSWLALMHLDGIEREDYPRGYEHGKMAGLAMVRGDAGALALALLQRSRAALLIFEGKSKEALSVLLSITAVIESEGSQSDISVLRTTMGDAEGAERNYEAALSHYKLALAHIESVLGPDHPENIYILNNMAVALKGSGDIKGARTALERSLAITERSYGDSVRAVVPILTNLGNINRRDGDLDAAREVLRRAIYVGEATMEPGHPLVTKAMLNLGIVLATDKDYPGATQAFRGVLARSEAHFKEDHPDKAMALNNLGEALFLEEKFEESLKYGLLAKEMKLRIHGEGHPRIASTLASLGTIYKAMGKVEEAQSYFESALAIFHGAAGETHPKTIFALSELGRLLESTGAAKKSLSYLERAIAARGADDTSLEQATDRFALVRAVAGTRGKKAAMATALTLQKDLAGTPESAALEAELSQWIDGR